MRDPLVERTPFDGGLRLRRIPGVLAHAMQELPALLADEAPGVRGRIQCSPYPGDEARSAEWSRIAAPDLAHLFESARATVLGDLAGLERDPGTRASFRIRIPGEHLAAWISSLGAARIGLGEAHGLDETALERPLPTSISCERDRAILLVHLLGWLQALLVETGRGAGGAG